ncbi:hypothetical protein [Yersinia enterocolitica]|uniref:hypothetical protein n=1 Tax=Yersinia enterocolitica TaxID=630 RepID=UPI003D78CF4A
MSHFLKGLSAEIFNQKYPVGSRFNYFSVKGIPDSVEVVTRTEAWALGHGDVVVSVNGRAGGLHIEHMKPVVIADSSLPVLSTEYLKEIINSPASELTIALATGLLSLREQLAEKEERLCRLRTSLKIEMKGHEAAERQLAELKALLPVAVLYRTGEVLTRAECADDRTFAVCCKVETPLFTAAKPADIQRGQG